MPGILPMKVIKVGTSSQARIAQACDRCRSKKIKCDGIRPCCSQCKTVGFECKTSDKLSRRAFPRGYTESLEERVRSLEAEVRELKDLLDEKDEKIDMLSKMHSNRHSSHASAPPTPSIDSREDSSPPGDDVFRVQASPLLLESGDSDLYFMGASSGRAFVDAFKRKIQETGKSCSTFNTEAFLNVQRDSTAAQASNLSCLDCIPPRIFSDKCVQIFWQEWAPLFPLLNKSNFLSLYEEYASDPEKMTDNRKLAQLHLVFSIAAISSNFPDEEQIALCEIQWQNSLNTIIVENTLSTVQCLTLATIYSLLKGDYKKLQQYKGISIAMSHRLGLHQSQKRFSFGALTMETRKKTFWTLYAVDCFSAATVGLPALLKDEDIHCEYPTNIDDEYITEKGFLPTLPGESPKVSAALALFRVSRILSKVLDTVYPAATSHDLSLQSLCTLETDLNEWSDNLPSHLKLTFVQDKPSTDVTGDRSAILSLAYYYIRSLIHRPAVGSALGAKASSSIISLAESSKHLIQIFQLLEERSMSFSFCINKNEALTLCGLGLLYQGLDLKQEGKLMKDGQRLVHTVIKYLDKASAPGALDFKRLATSMMPSDSPSKTLRQLANVKIEGTPTMTSSPIPDVPRKQSLPQPSRYPKIACSNDNRVLPHQKEMYRQATLPSSIHKHRNMSQSSLDSITSEPVMPRREYGARSPKSRTNLDYLPLSDTSSPVSSHPQYHVPLRSGSRNLSIHTPNFPPQIDPTSAPSSTQNKQSSVTPVEWESILTALESGDSNIYDAVYGGPAIGLISSNGGPNPLYANHMGNHTPNTPNSGAPHHNHSACTTATDLSIAATDTASSGYGDWSPGSWDMTDMTVLQFSDFDLNGGHGGGHGSVSGGPVAQSVLSYSGEESLSSGDDLDGYGDFGSGSASGSGSARHSFEDLYTPTSAPMVGADAYPFN